MCHSWVVALFPRSLPLSLLLPSPHILASCLRVHEELWAMGNHDGVVLLRNMPKAVYVKIDEPKAVYVKIDDTAELFLKAAPVTAATDGFPACRPRPAWSARAHPASPPLAAAAASLTSSSSSSSSLSSFSSSSIFRSFLAQCSSAVIEFNNHHLPHALLRFAPPPTSPRPHPR